MYSFAVCVCVCACVRTCAHLVAQLCLTLCDPMNCSSQLCPWDFLSKNNGVCCHFLLLGIFPTQDWTSVSCTAGRFFNRCAIREAPSVRRGCSKKLPHTEWLTATAAKSLQSCPTLWDPIDSSPPGFPVPGILQARTLEWVAISFSNAWKWKVKVKSLATPWTAAYQAPSSMGFSRQKYWSGVPLPSLWVA